MKRNKRVGFAILCGWLLFLSTAKADCNAYATRTLDVEATIGANFGGTSPLPLPAEIL
jgi:hypothetical protein